MPSTSRFHFSVTFLVVGALIALNCSLNDNGLGGAGGGQQTARDAGNDSRPGTGGGIPTAVSGGAPGTGGLPLSGTGGAKGEDVPGSGGASPIGGAAGDRATGSGGQPSASGGAVAETGGMTGTGGAGTGGVGTGGAGTGGAGTGGAGTGGAGTGGRGTGGAGTGGATASCNATTCPTGCCTTEGRCITTESNSRCGTRGAACAVCGNCFTCSAGACALVPTSRWDVICVSATIAPNRPNGRVWDTNGMGPPDPVCRSTLNGVTQAYTDAIPNTFSPMWNDDITPTVLPGMTRDGAGPGPGGGLTNRITAAALMNNTGPARWGIAVVDDDGSAFLNDPICAVTPALTAANFTASTVNFPAAESCLGLTIRLECAE